MIHSIIVLVLLSFWSSSVLKRHASTRMLGIIDVCYLKIEYSNIYTKPKSLSLDSSVVYFTVFRQPFNILIWTHSGFLFRLKFLNILFLVHFTFIIALRLCHFVILPLNHWWHLHFICKINYTHARIQNLKQTGAKQLQRLQVLSNCIFRCNNSILHV